MNRPFVPRILIWKTVNQQWNLLRLILQQCRARDGQELLPQQGLIRANHNIHINVQNAILLSGDILVQHEPRTQLLVLGMLCEDPRSDVLKLSLLEDWFAMNGFAMRTSHRGSSQSMPKTSSWVRGSC